MLPKYREVEPGRSMGWSQPGHRLAEWMWAGRQVCCWRTSAASSKTSRY